MEAQSHFSSQCAPSAVKNVKESRRVVKRVTELVSQYSTAYAVQCIEYVVKCNVSEREEGQEKIRISYPCQSESNESEIDLRKCCVDSFVLKKVLLNGKRKFICVCGLIYIQIIQCTMMLAYNFLLIRAVEFLFFVFSEIEDIMGQAAAAHSGAVAAFDLYPL